MSEPIAQIADGTSFIVRGHSTPAPIRSSLRYADLNAGIVLGTCQSMALPSKHNRGSRAPVRFSSGQKER